MQSLREVLDTVPDPRDPSGRRHAMGAVLALAVGAMLCGARSVYAISQWGRDQGEAVGERLGFRRGQTPCVATVHRIFRRMDRGAFEGVLGQWLQEQDLHKETALAVDGKTLRGIHGEQVPGVHLVAAYAHRLGIVMGQQAAKGKGQELEAVAALLTTVPLQGRVVTGDAQFAQRELSRQVVEKGGTISG